ncbi:MAG: ABC transporter ATP-binding protein [Firmicutes bacterium]|nr:ABC transporter ATP-binding protein [Bacillota bacterium]
MYLSYFYYKCNYNFFRRILMNSNMIEIKKLNKSFKDKLIIDKLNLEVKKGDIFGFLGPNGSGKTTTIRMLLNLIYPDDGTIKINGYNIKKDFDKVVDNIGAIVENPKFYPYLSARKNLKLMANLISNLSNDRVNEVLKTVGLYNRADDKVNTYSLGMKQRLGIANALLNKPELVILDEPTNGLDPKGMKEIRDLITRLAKENNITFFISTHLLNEVEQICNRAVIIKNGKVISQGNVKDLINIDHEILEIHTEDGKKAYTYINDLSYVKNVKVTKQGIRVQIEKNKSDKLNKLLINKGIDIKYSIPIKQSLEEYFLKLINEGDKSD